MGPARSGTVRRGAERSGRAGSSGEERAGAAMGKVQLFEIRLGESRVIYSPGEPLAGTVTVRLSGSLQYRGERGACPGMGTGLPGRRRCAAGTERGRGSGLAAAPQPLGRAGPEHPALGCFKGRGSRPCSLRAPGVGCWPKGCPGAEKSAAVTRVVPGKRELGFCFP